MPLSIGPFPNWLPIGPCPPLHGPAFLQPKSFWDIWDLSDSLSHVALSFQWVPGHAGLPGNELANSLAKTGATSPLPMFPARWLRSLQRFRHPILFVETKFFSTPSSAIFLQFPRRNWPFPVSPALNCLDFAATVKAFSCPLTYAG